MSTEPFLSDDVGAKPLTMVMRSGRRILTVDGAEYFGMLTRAGMSIEHIMARFHCASRAELNLLILAPFFEAL